MFNFIVDRKYNSAAMAGGIEHYLPFELRARQVRQHVYIGFCPDAGGYVASSCYWKVADLMDESSELEFDAFYEQWQDTRLTEYDPATGKWQWKI